MPELPEVETVRRDLTDELLGRRIQRVRVRKADLLLDGGPVDSFCRCLEGRRVDALDRRGKYLLFRLDENLVLLVQLRMSGRFVLGAELPDPEEFRHVVAEFSLDDGRTLFYDDVRRLGGFRLLSAPEWREEARKLGPEPLADGFTSRRLAQALASSRAPVKNTLLDQRRLAGVGNIYASEALHRARIDPRRAAGSLDEAEMRRLHRALRRVLREALASAGTSFRNYRAVNGRSGEFQERLRVYGREGEPCPRCGEPIQRIVQAGRSSFFCLACQT